MSHKVQSMLIYPLKKDPEERLSPKAGWWWWSMIDRNAQWSPQYQSLEHVTRGQDNQWRATSPLVSSSNDPWTRDSGLAVGFSRRGRREQEQTTGLGTDWPRPHGISISGELGTQSRCAGFFFPFPSLLANDTQNRIRAPITR